MLDELIIKTNDIDFYHDGDFCLIGIKTEVGKINVSEFNFIMEELDEITFLKKQTYWKIISHNTIKYKNLNNRILLPYIKIKILDNHPLLWNYKEEIYRIEFQKFPKNLSEFIGDLTIKFEKITGNWVNLNQHLFNINEYCKRNSSAKIMIPKSLRLIFEDTCKKHEVSFNIEKVLEQYDRNFDYKPNVKLLIFGNDDVSPNSYNLNQPYIIADSFEATKMK